MPQARGRNKTIDLLVVALLAITEFLLLLAFEPLLTGGLLGGGFEVTMMLVKAQAEIAQAHWSL